MDDQQRARELLAQAYANEGGWVADAAAEVRAGHLDRHDKAAIAAITAALRAAPEGFVLVPVEMDLEMEVAFCEAWFSERRCIDDVDMQDAWAAALAARPQGVKG